MTDAEFDRSMAPFAPLIERGYQATLTLNRLAADEGFRQRYLKGEPLKNVCSSSYVG